MILYGSSLSPYVRKVMAYCVEKGITFDLKPTGIGDPDPGFRAASPFRKMPAIDDEGYQLADSSAILHYLEAKHPEPALIPADARERGKAIWYDEFADTLFMACMGKMFFNRVVAPRFLGRDGDLEAADIAERDELPPLLDYLESVVGDGDYLVGGRLSIADLAVASPFANLDHCGAPIDAARHPRLAVYVAKILARPSFARTIEFEKGFLARTA
jgi:glutathione S-transferase